MRTLIEINVDNHIDLITNSSSELFVLNGNTLATVQEMVQSAYPEYLSEYYEVVKLQDASISDKTIYYDWAVEPWHNQPKIDWKLPDEEKKKLELQYAESVAKKYNIAPSKFYKCWKDRNKTKWFNNKLTEYALNKIFKDKKYDNVYLLFSIDKNPNWEMQEKLQNIGRRYHLG